LDSFPVFRFCRFVELLEKLNPWPSIKTILIVCFLYFFTDGFYSGQNKLSCYSYFSAGVLLQLRGKMHFKTRLLQELMVFSTLLLFLFIGPGNAMGSLGRVYHDHSHNISLTYEQGEFYLVLHHHEILRLNGSSSHEIRSVHNHDDIHSHAGEQYDHNHKVILSNLPQYFRAVKRFAQIFASDFYFLGFFDNYRSLLKNALDFCLSKFIPLYHGIFTPSNITVLRI